jgi:hypothetical protein
LPQFVPLRRRQCLDLIQNGLGFRAHASNLTRSP